MGISFQNKLLIMINLAKLADNYSKHNNYSNIINLMTELVDYPKTEQNREMENYVYLALLSDEIISMINEFKYDFKLKDLSHLENYIEIKELNHLLTAFNKDHKLVYLFVIFAVLKWEPVSYDRFSSIEKKQKQDENIFIPFETVIPIYSLNHNDDKNVETLKEFESFYKICPSFVKNYYYTDDSFKKGDFFASQYLTIKTITNNLEYYFEYAMNIEYGFFKELKTEIKHFFKNELAILDFITLEPFIEFDNLPYSYNNQCPEHFLSYESNAFVVTLDIHKFAKEFYS